ncbi:MAG: hypothetical protein RJA19_384 [Bacteroidota bacterium]|jgi:hypothetical protein
MQQQRASMFFHQGEWRVRQVIHRLSVLWAILWGAMWSGGEGHAQYIATSADNICAGEVVNMYINVAPWYPNPVDADPDDWQFTWLPAYLFNGASTQAVSVVMNDSELIEVEAIAPDGELWVVSIFLDVYPAFSVTASSDVAVCSTDGIQLSAVADTPVALNWTWSPAVGLSDAGIPNPVIVGEVNQIYTVTAEVAAPNGEGCTAQDVVAVDALGPELELGGDVVACTGEEVTLSSGFTASTEHLWTLPDGTTSDAISVAVNAAGTVSLTVETVDGCSATDAVQVGFSDGPVLDIEVPEGICESTGAVLDATPVSANGAPFSYAWSTGASGPALWVNATGSYAVTVVDGAGCSSSATVEVNALPSPPVMLPADTAFCFDDFPDAVYLLQVAGGFSGYEWNTGAMSNTVVVEGPGTYEVEVTNTVGCTTFMRCRVEAFCGMPLLFVPTAFSPDGNDLNEVLRIEGRNLMDLDFQLFNRWGEKVWTADEVGDYWHGQGPGGTHYVDGGPYVWVARFRYVMDSAGTASAWEERTGSIQVLR